SLSCDVACTAALDGSAFAASAVCVVPLTAGLSGVAGVVGVLGTPFCAAASTVPAAGVPTAAFMASANVWGAVDAAGLTACPTFTLPVTGSSVGKPCIFPGICP